MSEFRVGDRVEVVKPHTYHGNVAGAAGAYKVGDVGTIMAAKDWRCSEEEGIWVVQLDGQSHGEANFVDEECLEHEVLVTQEDVDAAISSITGAVVERPWKIALSDEQATAVGHVIWFLTDTGQSDAAAAVESEFGVVM